MLRDLIAYAQSPFDWYLAPMGYVRETRLIARRAREIGAAWGTHTQATRRIIEEAAAHCPRQERVTVVGSGNLLDVPLAHLCRTFEKVILIDILHAQAARQAARAWDNVELVAADVTGVTRAIFDAARRRKVQTLPKSVPPELARSDLIVSVNLLSQLGVIPYNYLTGHCPGIPPGRLDAFSRDLIETHLRWLVHSADRVCLVTDVLRIETPLDGEAHQKDILEGVALPPPDETWDWEIAPRGSIFWDLDVVHRVQAYRDFRWEDPAARVTAAQPPRGRPG